MCVFPRLTEGETMWTAKPLDRNGWTVIKKQRLGQICQKVEQMMTFTLQFLQRLETEETY